MKYYIEDTEDYTLGEINDYLRNELAKTNLNKDDILIEGKLKDKIAIVELDRIFDENGMSEMYEIDINGIHLKQTGNCVEFSKNELASRFDDALASMLSGLANLECRPKEYTSKHSKLIDILQSYGNKEFGDSIVDEICELFNHPLTPEE
jgi:hypothetical protein